MPAPFALTDLETEAFELLKSVKAAFPEQLGDTTMRVAVMMILSLLLLLLLLVLLPVLTSLRPSTAKGGWVRDKILGRESDDIDVCLSDQLGNDFALKINEYLASQQRETHTIAKIEANPEASKQVRGGAAGAGAAGAGAGAAADAGAAVPAARIADRAARAARADTPISWRRRPCACCCPAAGNTWSSTW